MSQEHYVVDPYDTRGRALTPTEVFAGRVLLELHRDAVVRARVTRDGASLGERWIVLVEDGSGLEAHEYTLHFGALRDRTIDAPWCICGCDLGEGAEYEHPEPDVGVPGGWYGCEVCIPYARRAAEEARVDLAVDRHLERRSA